MVKLLEPAKNILPFELNKIYNLTSIGSDYDPLPQEDIEKIIKIVVDDLFPLGNSPNTNPSADADVEQLSGSNQDNRDYLMHGDFFRSRWGNWKEAWWAWKIKDMETTLVKRLSKVLYNWRSLELSASAKEKIGNIARANSNLDKIVYFDFDKEISWTDGDFGDKDSCFFKAPGEKSSRSEILRNIRRDPRIYAIRFYHPQLIQNKTILKYMRPEQRIIHQIDGRDHLMHGYARAWLIIEPSFAILVNAYGLHLETIAKAYGNYLTMINSKKADIRFIDVRDKGNESGNFFIGRYAENSDGMSGKGIIVGEKEVINKISNYDIGLDESLGIKASPIPIIGNNEHTREQIQQLKDSEPPAVIHAPLSRFSDYMPHFRITISS